MIILDIRSESIFIFWRASSQVTRFKCSQSMFLQTTDTVCPSTLVISCVIMTFLQNASSHIACLFLWLDVERWRGGWWSYSQQGCGLAFLSVKPLDIFDEVPQIFNIWKHDITGYSLSLGLCPTHQVFVNESSGNLQVFSPEGFLSKFVM